MRVTHRTHSIHDDETLSVEPAPTTRLARGPAPVDRRPRTREWAARWGIGVAVTGAIALVVFMVQNTGSLSFTQALIIAGVGLAVLAIAVAVTRMTYLRRQSRRP